MTVRLVVSCNGTWPGRPCRGAFPAGAVDKARARELAKANQWSTDRNADYCPACTRRRAKENQPS